MIKTPLENNNEPIKNVGIRCRDNAAEFDTLTIGQIPDPAVTYSPQMYLNYYYPLSALALSDIPYDTAVLGDQSVFSKKNVILTGGSLKGNDINTYLEFAKRGGNLFIINPDYAYSDEIKKLFAIQAENKSRFNFISDLGHGKPLLDINGTVNPVKLNDKESYIKSVYKNDEKVVAPFVIQQILGEGTITLINAGGYFDSILKQPEENFGSLSDFRKLVSLNSSKHFEEDSINSKYPIRFVGNLSLNGRAVINDSSIDFGLDNNSHNGLYADRISFIRY